MNSEEIIKWAHTELWHQIPVQISVIDRDYNIVAANRFFKANYGPWRGHQCFEMYKGRSEQCENCAAAKTFTDGQIRVQEELGRVQDGRQTYYIAHMVPLLTPDGEIPYIIETLTDITATKELEREKLVAERLAAVGQTVAGLAHGIKNLLMGLEGGMYVTRSGMEKADPTRIAKGWQMLEENITRISAFVKEFLDFAKGRTPKVAMTAPNEIARQVIDLFKDKAHLAGIELKSNLRPGIPEAPMDEEAIHACLTNLVSNALDACEVSDKTDSHEVTLSTRDEEGKLIFEVADNGTGMDYDIQKKVFTNFFSTKGSEKGTGLGLLTTRKIVQEHGGKVSFESTEGVGSVFRLIFPRDRFPGLGGEEDE